MISARMIGTGLGHYTITSHLGSGGMGEVYQATDAKLGRDVAVKFLSEAFVHDASHLARLHREARALAALNHPHVAAIYGLEEIAGRHFLVMELVQGTTLATKLAGGRLTLDDTIRYGTQIADALAAAHARGIVHRDLKPGNIMVAKSGVKVLDFGLAKSADGDETLTRTEAIMGTPAYMAPEQREGGACDARSDIYSFGLILLEMATGRRVVDGAVLNGLPAPLARVVHGCLERDPDARWQSAADIKRALMWVTTPTDAKPGPSSRPITWAAVALIAGIVVGTAGVWFFRPAPAPVDRVFRFDIPQTGPTALAINANGGADLAFTPDGSRLVYAGNNGSQLFVRKLDSLESVPIANGTRIQTPVVSPNGNNVFYLDNAFVMTVVSINGGPSVKLSSTGRGGATWLDDETVVAGASSRKGKGLRLINVKAPTEPETELTRVDTAAGEAAHVWPQTLPDGRSILFTITAQRGGLDAAQLAVFDIQTRQTKVLLRGSGARYVAAPRAAPRAASGYLVYVAQRALWAIPFDLGSLETRGQAVQLPVRLPTDIWGGGQFATDDSGMLAYVDASGSASDASRSIVWVDWRTGKETRVGQPGPYAQARVSPDETKIAVVAFENDEGGIGILDMRREVFTWLKLDPVAVTGYPVWLPDGKRIAFQGWVTGGSVSMWTMAADGTGTPTRLLTSNNPQMATSAPSDGYLVFHEATPQSETSLDVWRMKLDGSHQLMPLLKTTSWETAGMVSPDKQWIAYECCSEERNDIWVSLYPKTDGGKWQVSKGGGRRANWSPEGDQLFYVAADGSLMRVPVDARASSWAVSPTPALPAGALTMLDSAGFDISRDGRRVLTLKPTNPEPLHIVVVLNWVEELVRASR